MTHLKHTPISELDAGLIADFLETNLDAFGEFLEQREFEGTEAALIVDALRNREPGA